MYRTLVALYNLHEKPHTSLAIYGLDSTASAFIRELQETTLIQFDGRINKQGRDFDKIRLSPIPQRKGIKKALKRQKGLKRALKRP